jgi:hypothetical protein
MKENNVATRMAVCRECLALRGDFFDTFNRCERTQRCGCSPREPLWNAFDYNTAAELCYWRSERELTIEQLLEENANTPENKRRWVNMMLAKDPTLERKHVESWWDQAAEQLGL